LPRQGFLRAWVQAGTRSGVWADPPMNAVGFRSQRTRFSAAKLRLLRRHESVVRWWSRHAVGAVPVERRKNFEKLLDSEKAR